MTDEPQSLASGSPLRPRDLALLLLASGDLRPRKRARDQQADRAGLQLKRQVLQAIASIDPEPVDFEAALFRIVEEMGPPTGPARAIAMVVWEEWQSACTAPEWVAHLLGQAVEEHSEEHQRERSPH